MKSAEEKHRRPNRRAGPRSCVAAALFAILLSAPSGRPAIAGEKCAGCTQLGSLSVVFVSQEPAEVEVGELVTFTYSYTASLPGGVSCEFGGCRFVGGEAILGGDDPPVRDRGQVTVQRVALAAGTASVQLIVRATTEERCFYLDEFGCQSYFQPVPIQASSGPRPVLVSTAAPGTPTRMESPTAVSGDSPTPTSTLEADTPTPTGTGVLAATETPTQPSPGNASPTAADTPAVDVPATATPGPRDEDDGCAIAPSPRGVGLAWLLGAVLILSRLRRRARRDTQPSAHATE